MRKKIIKKKLAYSPNLKNYQKTYKIFSWDDASKEIEYFPDGLMNAAYAAIDVNAKNARKNKVALYWESDSGEELKLTFLEMSILSDRWL